MNSGQVMKTTLSQVKSKASYLKNYLVGAYLGASVMASSMNPVGAAGITIGEGNIEGADALIGNLLGFVTSMARYIGIILLVWGIIQFIMAFRNEDADSKSRSIMVCVMAIVLISVKSIAQAILSGM